MKRKKERKILNRTLILRCGRPTVSTMYMICKQHRTLYMKIRQNLLYIPFLKVIMQLCLPMVKLVPEKRIQWKDLNIMLEIPKEVSFHDRWRKYSSSYRCNQTRTRHSWCELHTSKSTMKLFLIYSKSSELPYKSEKIERRAYSWKD